MLSKIQSAATYGLDGTSVVVEVDIVRRGFPTFKIVGLPDKSVAEAKERVRSALRNSGFGIPEAKIIINLAPADIPKKGSLFDVPVALGILVSDGVLSHKHSDESLFVGELSLDGSVSAVPGVLPIVLFAKSIGIKKVYIPAANKHEAMYIEGIEVFPVETFKKLIDHLTQRNPIAQIESKKWELHKQQEPSLEAFVSVRGQAQAKRALEIAAAGGHNILIKGPPGTGKTLLAEAFASLLPPLSEEEHIEVVKIRSVTEEVHTDAPQRAFRAPHHTISLVGLIGGGGLLSPGEVTRAHRGVLFLDEMPEFSRKSIDALRQPLESGFVTITRARGNIVFPAQFTLIATANPCPCGYLGHPQRECICTQTTVFNYTKKISGPIMDRIDIHIYINAVDHADIQKEEVTTEASEIRNRISHAHKRQSVRYHNTMKRNAQLTHQEVSALLPMQDEAKAMLVQAYKKLSMSARSYFKTIKIAQTIADLEGAASIQVSHIAEAIQYRI